MATNDIGELKRIWARRMTNGDIIHHEKCYTKYMKNVDQKEKNVAGISHGVGTEAALLDGHPCLESAVCSYCKKPILTEKP